MSKKWLVVSGWWLVGAMALTAQADTQTWSETQSFNADEVIYDPVELDGEVTVSVASGKTVIISNAVSDVSGKKGKITLVGGGTLTLAHANTFTGGAYIDTGVLATTIADSLGTGDITIDGGTTKTSQLWFLFSDGVNPKTTITVANKIAILHGGNSSHRQIRYTPGATKDVMKYLKLTGGLTCAGDLYWNDDNEWNANIGRVGMYFYCDITVDGELNFSRPTVYAQFLGAVKAKKISSGNTEKGAAIFYFYSNQNSIGQFSPNRLRIVCVAAEVLGGASFVCSSKSSSSPDLNLGGYNQTMAYLETSGTIEASHKPYIQNDITNAVATLTLTGGVDKAVLHGRFWTDNDNGIFNGSLRVDAATQPDFTQVFTNCDQTINGSAIVDAGNLVFNGDTTLTNLTGIVVNGGTFTLDTTDTGDIPALKSLAAITVKKDAKLTLKGANLFGKIMAITLETGATFNIPSGTILPASSLTFNGEAKGFGTYTKTEIPVLPDGVRICVGGDVDWNGAADDNLTTSGDNWSKEGAENVVQDGSLNVTLTGGDGLDYGDGDWLVKIVNNIEPNKDNPVKPFVIKPAIEGANLHLDYGITSNEKTQLILSGHITDLPRQSSDSDNLIYCKLSTNRAGVDGAIQPTLKTTNKIIPLVLTNATLDTAMTVTYSYSGQVSPFVASPHTTNEVRGLTYIYGYTQELCAETNSITRFLGGYQSSNTSSFRGLGEFVVDKSISVWTRAAVVVKDGCTLSLSTTNGCRIGGTQNTSEGIKIATGKLNLLADNALNPELQVWAEEVSDQPVLEMNATTQTIGVLCFPANADNTAAYLHGDYPAKLTLTGKHRGGAYKESVKEPYCSARIDGWLSLCYTGEGTNEVFTLENRAFGSYGDLEVSGKKLLLGSDATWLNGTNFTARGSGTLAFTAAGQVNSDFAVVHIADTGKVEIAENVTVTVYRAETNGVWLAAGNYKGTGGASDATVIEQLTGKGVLSVLSTTYDVSGCGEANVTNVVVNSSWVSEYVKSTETITNVPSGGNGYPYWKSYVLGLTPTNPVSKPIIKGVQGPKPDKLNFTLGNVQYNSASGVKVKYKIKESNSVNGTYTEVENSETNAGEVVEIDLPSNCPVKYYKVNINYSN